MSLSVRRRTYVLIAVLTLAAGAAVAAQYAWPAKADDMQLIEPRDLVAQLQNPKAEKPLILNVGPRLLFVQAHIPGAEYIGATGEPQGLEALRTRLRSVPKTKPIVIYCGCCPWSHCPNVRPGYAELRKLGFTKAKVLYIADNLGTDWVYKGYPTAKGDK